MTRIVVNGGRDQLCQALKLLGPKVLAYDAQRGWLMVREEEAESVTRVLVHHGIQVEIRRMAAPS